MVPPSTISNLTSLSVVARGDSSSCKHGKDNIVSYRSYYLDHFFDWSSLPYLTSSTSLTTILIGLTTGLTTLARGELVTCERDNYIVSYYYWDHFFDWSGLPFLTFSRLLFIAMLEVPESNDATLSTGVIPLDFFQLGNSQLFSVLFELALCAERWDFMLALLGEASTDGSLSLQSKCRGSWLLVLLNNWL